MKNRISLTLTALALSTLAWAAPKHTVSGYVRDQHGEALIGANVIVKELSVGAISNTYGFFSLTLPDGSYTLVFNYLGYKDQTRAVNLADNVKLDILLETAAEEIEAVEIRSTRRDANVRQVEMSSNKLQMAEIKRMPVLMGEVDVLKSIQLLPGVQSGVEGSSGFTVRGGNVDQNLILLDDAPVYNASHLAGFFSVFNGDAIKDVNLIKGGIPAEYGGRLSSVLDIKMKEGNSTKLKAEGGIGIISSRLMVEGPVYDGVSTFMLAGRRTYADLLLLASRDTTIKESTLYFYDLNAKINLRINDKNRIYLSNYYGRDVMGFSDMMSFRYGNGTTTLRWNHLFSEKLFFNARGIYSNYTYILKSDDGTQKFDWESHIIDYNLNADLTWYANPDNTIKAGGGAIFHTFKPGEVHSSNEGTDLEYILPDRYAIEYNVFAQNQQNITTRLSAQYGLRWSIYQNLGTDSYFLYNKANPEEYLVDDTVSVGEFNAYNYFHGIEPRLSMRYSLGRNNSVKASYQRTYQYMHLATNTTATTPIDVWFPSSPNIKPQRSDQYAAGYFHNFFGDQLEASFEMYYKDLTNVIDFRDNALLLINDKMEGEVRTGYGWSYGAEFMLRKQTGDFTGWISYTLSTTRRRIPEVNKGKSFFAPYDKPHNLAVVLSYSLGDRWEFATTFVYSSPSPKTLPVARVEFGNTVIPVYPERNTERIYPYHRLDVSITRYMGQSRRHSLNLSVYNVYNRHNPYSLTFETNYQQPLITEGYSMSLFGAVPSITYNFKFEQKNKK